MQSPTHHTSHDGTGTDPGLPRNVRNRRNVRTAGTQDTREVAPVPPEVKLATNAARKTTSAESISQAGVPAGPTRHGHNMNEFSHDKVVRTTSLTSVRTQQWRTVTMKLSPQKDSQKLLLHPESTSGSATALRRPP